MSVWMLDGPMGSRLSALGVDTSGPAWSARALTQCPDVVADVHHTYIDLGARIHRTNTFRTRHAELGDSWEHCARVAVQIAQESVTRARSRGRGGGARPMRVAGSLGPVNDCYRPESAPSDEVALAEHRALAAVLVDEGVDLLLCETFPAPSEARMAVRACVETGLETWVALTAGPDGELMSPAALADAARSCRDLGATVVLVNCIAAERTSPFVEALQALGGPFGVYPNAACWDAPAIDLESWRRQVQGWLEAGAAVLGGCCGMTPEHLAVLAHAMGAREAADVGG